MADRPKRPRVRSKGPVMPRRHTITAADARKLLARNMRRLRHAAGLTQAQGAELAGMNDRHWQKLEGRYVAATVDTLAQIASGLGTTIADLFQTAKNGGNGS